MKRIIGMLIVLLCTSCSMEETHKRRAVKTLAGDNAGELQRVPEHYKGDSQKRKAAEYLLYNMGHGYGRSALAEEYRRRVMLSDARSINELNELWFAVKDSFPGNGYTTHYDARELDAAYLIRNIDEAFDAWENAPWHKQINFDTFCRYILPYRVLNEPPSDWRRPLREKYAHLIEGEEDPEKAYQTVYRHLVSNFDTRSLKCPYTPDVMFTDRLMTGLCAYRCVYVVSVMRALGIPASYDFIRYWANYSTSGHSWVSYTPSDTAAVKAEYIDASVFSMANVKNRLAHRYKVDTLKRVSKIFRQKYDMDILRIPPADNSVPSFFKLPFVTDVSGLYKQTSLSATVELPSPAPKHVFLCTFASIDDWQAAAMGRISHGKARFDNIGGGIAYLPACYDENGIPVPLSNPFVLQEDNSIRKLEPDTTRTQRMVLRRKYVMYGHWLKRWEKMVDARFEASDTPDFRNPELLYKVTSIPEGITHIPFHPAKAYRYVRVQVREDARPDIAELAFFGEDAARPLEGRCIYAHIPPEEVEKTADGDYTTHGGSPEEHYWLGLDLGPNPPKVKAAKFCMRHDMNMVVAGHEYELFYYDGAWRSLGRRTATCDSLVYEAPLGALFWLHDHTKGREERIFTYESNRQEWW